VGLHLGFQDSKPIGDLAHRQALPHLIEIQAGAAHQKAHPHFFQTLEFGQNPGIVQVQKDTPIGSISSISGTGLILLSWQRPLVMVTSS
jgi:hypothetical protein